VSRLRRWLAGARAALVRALFRLRRRLGRRPRPALEPLAARRHLLRAGAAMVAGAAVLGAPSSVRASAAPRRRWGMVIDLDRCTSCSACTIACRQENNIPAFGPEAEYRGAHIEWMSMLWQEPEQPGGLPLGLPFPCQHCADAPCIKVCPVGATYKSPDGITLQIWDRCIGCRYCMVACPYGRRSFNWEAPRWDGTLAQLLNPDVATRPAGVVEKCTFCHHRIRKVEQQAAMDGRALRDDEVERLPACAAACPADAIVFGDLTDPDAQVSRLARSPRRFRLLDHLGTDPSVIYLKRDRR
jgi:menaquinone reductase, iron-sulfur cluster-binding subunit